MSINAPLLLRVVIMSVIVNFIVNYE